ncbi:MAG: DUF4199 domain-containing protein [Gracilimonas sp.]|uniref:DUF4199 domain-containing protein n=1 Tax=Gracilimonas sp. TaxID=1974203 RepID=UPI003751104C|nr:DUF4199 domain-containing protein [Gracilimonas sp.]
MENEQTQPSYWNSVILASLITAILVTAFSLIGGYMTLGSEPSGSFFSSAQLFSTIGCLVGALGGLFANWHYVKENDVTYKIGKGALLGLMVGLGATIFSVIISQIWNVIDPGFQEALIEWNIQNLEAMQMPAEAREQAIAGFDDPNSLQNIGLQALFTFIGLGIVNVISGLIGAKVFASEE